MTAAARLAAAQVNGFGLVFALRPACESTIVEADTMAGGTVSSFVARTCGATATLRCFQVESESTAKALCSGQLLVHSTTVKWCTAAGIVPGPPVMSVASTSMSSSGPAIRVQDVVANLDTVLQPTSEKYQGFKGHQP